MYSNGKYELILIGVKLICLKTRNKWQPFKMWIFLHFFYDLAGRIEMVKGPGPAPGPYVAHVWST